MEEKKQIKISLKTAIILIFSIIIILGVGIYVITKFVKKQDVPSNINENNITNYSNINQNNDTNVNTTKKYSDSSNTNSNNIESIVEDNLRTGYYSGASNHIENAFVSSYSELEQYVNQYGTITIDSDNKNEKINENALTYFDDNYFKDHTLAIEAHDASELSYDKHKINNITFNGTEANIDITITNYSYGGLVSPTIRFTFVTLDKNITNAKLNVEIEQVEPHDNITTDKPIIYLYPTQDTEVSVKLQNKDNITVSYPKYSNGWNVLARKDGTLTELSTNKNLYSLYYESKNMLNFKVENDGFIVKGDDVAEFLEEKLAILGLTERETEEFIIYWLPKLEANKYNYIRFATLNEINKNMPLEINPKPDTIIRVLMTFKGLDNPIEIKEQTLTTPERKGFVAVEWGGTEIE